MGGRTGDRAAPSKESVVPRRPSRQSPALVFSWLSQEILGGRKDEMLTAIAKLGFWPPIGGKSVVCLP